MKIGILFPGYGSQFVGMAKELYDESRLIQEYFEEASNCLNINFVKLCFASSDTELSKMQSAYTALFLVSSALYALLKEEGVKADRIMGYNLGGYTALHAAGGISFPDGLYLLNKFATIYQEAATTMDVSLLRIKGIPVKTIEMLCAKNSTSEYLTSIALYINNNDCIIGGNRQAVQKVEELLQGAEVTREELPLEVGLHSSLMDPLVQQYSMYLEKVDCKDLIVPVVNSLTAKRIEQGEQVKEYIVAQLNNPIMLHKGIETYADCDLILEVGPGSFLTDLVKIQYPDKIVMSINKRSDIEDVKKYITSSTQPVETSNGTP